MFLFVVYNFFNELDVTNNPDAGKVDFSAVFDVVQEELNENGRQNATRQYTFLFTTRNIDYPTEIDVALKDVNLVYMNYLVGKCFCSFFAF